MTEDEMVGWHHRLDGHEFEQALGFCSFLTSLSLPRIEKSGALLWIKGM